MFKMTEFGGAVFWVSVLKIVILLTEAPWEERNHPENFSLSTCPEGVLFFVSGLGGMLLRDLYMVYEQWETSQEPEYLVKM